MRKILLWMARNPWLRDRLPRLWFAKRAVRRFMPGEDAESALTAGAQFQIEGIGTLYTRLGENLTRIEEADEVATHYLDVMDEIRDRRIDGEVSLKLTQIGYDLDVERTFEHAAALAARAARDGRTLWVDMEGSAYAEGTIAFYERLKVTHPNVGICLQAYLKRTAA
ncbi:MAG: proline dehydrogenase family protein, partial [Candidatus Limnocylindrales bacterium]